ncbi:hypothetical protein PMAYCL1PPCAC_32457, partial [Pristionchus mayeri]
VPPGYGSTSISSINDTYVVEARIHAIVSLLAVIPAIFLIRSSNNNTEISRERLFFAFVYFTIICSLIRTVQHAYYLVSIGNSISINQCTIMAHLYYVAEVLPQQMMLIVLVNSYMEKVHNRAIDVQNLWECAAAVIALAILLNIAQFFIGTASPNFPLCLPYNINFDLNDVYHHIGFAILFVNIALSAYLCFGETKREGGASDSTSSSEIRWAVHFSLFVYSFCCLAVILPLSFYTHIY